MYRNGDGSNRNRNSNNGSSSSSGRAAQDATRLELMVFFFFFLFSFYYTMFFLGQLYAKTAMAAATTSMAGDRDATDTSRAPCMFFISFYFLYYTNIFFRSGDGSSNSGRGSRLHCHCMISFFLRYSLIICAYIHIFQLPPWYAISSSTNAPKYITTTCVSFEGLYFAYTARAWGCSSCGPNRRVQPHLHSPYPQQSQLPFRKLIKKPTTRKRM